MTAQGKDIARFTALMQREEDLPIPEGTALHPPPHAPKPPDECPIVKIPIAGSGLGYGDLVENRIAAGQFFKGPCAAWFRMNHPLVKDEDAKRLSARGGRGGFRQRDQRVVGLCKYLFINCDLTINLFRRPEGEWVCLEARSLFGGNGCGLAKSALYDERGMIGRATQSLTVRPR